MESAEQIVEKAVKDFELTLDHRKLEHFSRTTITQVKTRIKNSQASQETFKTLVAPSRLRFFLEAWEKFDLACQGLRTGASQLSGLIWGPLDWVLRASVEDPKTLDRILQSYLDLGQRLVPISQHGHRLTENDSLRRCLAWMLHDLLDFHSHILKLFEPRDWRPTFESQWKDYNEKGLFKYLLDSFRRNTEFIKNALDNQVSHDTLRRLNDHVSRHGIDMSEIMRHIEEYEQDRERLFAEARESERARKHAQYIEILSWLRSPVESEMRRHSHCQAIRREFPNTCNWVLNEEKVYDWMELETPPYSMLWLQGTKGAGKTVLASLLIDQLTTYHTDAITSYFYCKAGDEKSGEGLYLTVLKSLLRQILSQNRDFLATLHDRRANSRNGVEILDDEGTAKSLLDMLCSASGRHFIVIDGLDEMERADRKAVWNCLSSIVHRSDGYSPGRIRVLLVSTDLDDMRGFSKSVDHLDIYDLDQKGVQKDIDTYLRKRSLAWQRKFRLSEEELDRAVGMISAKANGMFLYAFLVSDNLLNQKSTERFAHQVEASKFPKDLTDAYNRILERLQEENEDAWEEARKIFSWLICATRPLKWHELQTVLSMHIDENGIIEYSNRKRFCGDIREICGSLIRVVGTTIEFIHQTAEIYVIQNEGLDRKFLEADAALLCLSYLTHPCFHSTQDQTLLENYTKEGVYAFQDYAIARWDTHLIRMIKGYPNVFRDPVKGSEYQQKANAILRQFFWLYQHDLFMSEDDRMTHNDRVQSDCQAVQELVFHDACVAIHAHVIRHHNQGIQKRCQVSLPGLNSALEKSREAIQKLSAEDSTSSIAEEYYGVNLHKCSRATCAFFYEGFDDGTALKHHSNRHERPFACPADANCSLAQFGFTTSRDRERHVRMYHPDEPGSEATLSHASSQDGVDSPAENGRARFICDICGRRFTRNAILKAHTNSAHLGQKPHECPVCGKPFTRKNDMRRHERTRHVRR